MDFRKAQRQEHEDVLRLLRSAFVPYMQKLGRDFTANSHDWVMPAIERGDVFVGEEALALVGVVATHQRQAELVIDQIAVDPGRQGQGIGSQLLKEIEAVAQLRGATALSLHTAAFMDDHLRYYGQRGFVEVRRGPPPHDKDTALRVYMSKQL